MFSECGLLESLKYQQLFHPEAKNLNKTNKKKTIDAYAEK